MRTLSDAITAVETAGTSFNNAVVQTASDMIVAQQIQAKLDAANLQVDSDKQVQDAAAASFNGALDELIQAATAAKIPSSTPAPLVDMPVEAGH